MPNGRSRGRRRGRRPKRRSNEKGGRTVQTAAPALFAFMGSLSSSVGLSAWRWACAVPRCGSRCFRNGQRKAIIRTHRLSETGSDYIGLVRETGLEPACCHQHTDLNRARLPIPPFPLKVVDGGGFEPPKSATADLQSAPFGHSGTHPG